MSNPQDKIIALLKSTNRNGIDRLIQHMEETDFFTAPCSSAYHLSKEGGLAEHSLNVYETMLDIWGNTSIGISISDDNIVIAGLLHDLGKSSYRDKPNYVPNILKGGEISKSKPYETNKDRLYISHEIVSIVIASRYIDLTEEEEFAIMYHNGLYVASGRDIQGKERPLQQLLHFADMWCSRFTEER
jgi:23S rRNA maturation-related 3'-5' exoribonuclease YhaM